MLRKAIPMIALFTLLQTTASAQVTSFSGSIPSWTLYWTGPLPGTGELLLTVNNATITTVQNATLKTPLAFGLPAFALEPQADQPQLGKPMLVKLGTTASLNAIFSETQLSTDLQVGLFTDGCTPAKAMCGGYDFSWFGYGGNLSLVLLPASGKPADISAVLNATSGGISGVGYFGASLDPSNRMVTTAPWWTHSFIPR